MTGYTIMWIAVLILAIITEAATTSLVAIWFMPGTVIAILLSFLPIPFWVQATVFVVCGFSVIFRIIFKEKFKITNIVPTNADLVIGKTCLVTEEIDNINSLGAVKIGGTEWSARSRSGEKIEKGSAVRVIEIEGVKVIVEALSADPSEA